LDHTSILILSLTEEQGLKGYCAAKCTEGEGIVEYDIGRIMIGLD
jgi:hypothetical protein